MKLIVPLSGGKDSQATLLWCIEKYGVNSIEAVFCDTKWEHALTYIHLDYLVKKSGVKYRILSSEKYNGFIDLAKQKKRFPNSTTGFCTEELKVKPMIDYILSLDENVMIFQGIRKDESIRRSKMEAECRFFKYYFQPYISNEIIIERYEKRPPKTLNQKLELQKAIDRLAKGKNDEKYHTYRKQEIFEWCKQYADDIQRPFFDSTANDVISYSLNRDYDINPLYFKGASRVGCFPCKNATKAEMQLIIQEFPETIDKIRDGEKFVGSTFFSPNYIPKRYHSAFDKKSGKSIAIIDDVVRYLNDKNAQIDMLVDLEMDRSCKSVYHICE